MHLVPFQLSRRKLLPVEQAVLQIAKLHAGTWHWAAPRSSTRYTNKYLPRANSACACIMLVIHHAGSPVAPVVPGSVSGRVNVPEEGTSLAVPAQWTHWAPTRTTWRLSVHDLRVRSTPCSDSAVRGGVRHGESPINIHIMSMKERHSSICGVVIGGYGIIHPPTTPGPRCSSFD